MNAKFNHLGRLACLSASLLVSGLTWGAENEAWSELSMLLKGRWQGTISGALRAQDVSWRFEVDDSGLLTGFIGPTSAGYPEIPMDALSLSPDSIRFEVNAQDAVFEGKITGGEITGAWIQGLASSLSMRKQIFAYPLPGTMPAALQGDWQTRILGTRVNLQFSPYGQNSATGGLSIPSLGYEDMPMIEIIGNEAGYIQFATDIGRSFSGRLVNGVILGSYTNNGRTYEVLFERPDAEQHFPLASRESALDQLEGEWLGSVSGTRVTLRIQRQDQTTALGFLDIAGVGRDIPLLELITQGDGISFTSYNQRYFNGQYADDTITGSYSANGATYSVRFVKQPVTSN